jgi:hypothetical protein
MNKGNEEVPLYTAVDDELYEELCEMEGEKLAYVAVWEDSLADAIEDPDRAAPGRDADSFDVDLYLAGGVFFECYSVSIYRELDGEPLRDYDIVNPVLSSLVRQGAMLEEIAVDEADQLVLVVRFERGQRLYFAVSAWTLEEWDELPDE